MKRTIFVTVAIMFSLVSFCYALETDTHEVINEYIARNTLNGFSLDSYLKNQLGIQDGIEESFDSKKVWSWLREGGLKEDVPYWYMAYLRSVNHFHNPLTDQGFSGIWGTGFLEGESSVQWSQRALGTQSPGGHYSWIDVRSYFYRALSFVVKYDRDYNFAQTFRGLGQLMHLVQDKSVPEHTRDDGHYKPAYEAWAYEAWVKKSGDVYIDPETGIISIRGTTITPQIFYPSAIGNPNLLAPIPVANLFDTNRYNVTDPDPAVTLQPNIGLAEYTNANFLSKDTIFTSDFPYPSFDQCVFFEDNDRKYLKKNTGAGEQINHLAVQSWVQFWRLLFPQDLTHYPLTLDPLCYKDYASKLIPRAVGYSATLLDYFFRGTLEISAPDNYAYTIFDGSMTPHEFTSIKAKVRNTTTDEEIGTGTIQAVVRYRNQAELSYSVSAPIDIISLSSTVPEEFTFDFTNYPIPVGSTDLYLQVVFKGTLGNEEDTAIAVGMKHFGTLEISAPDNYAYTIIDGSTTPPHKFTSIKAKVKNITPDEIDEDSGEVLTYKDMEAGIIQAVAGYKKRTDYQPDLSTDPPTAASREDDFSYSVSAPINITSLSSTVPEEFAFDFTNDPIPVGITDLFLQVIFKGTLGDEADTAIAVGMKDLNEPMHICLWNTSDRFYLEGNLYTARTKWCQVLTCDIVLCIMHGQWEGR